MTLIHNLKRAIESVTGYSIYRKSVLPKGADLIIDLQNDFHNISIDVIFDVGANVGQSVKYFKKHFPNAHMYSFEPVKSTFDQLNRLKSSYTDVHFENIGLGSAVERVPIFIEKYSVWNSLVPNEKSNKKDTETIKLNTLDNYIKEKGLSSIDFLKSDTEGFDLEVLRGAQNTLADRKIGFIYIEIGMYSKDKRHSYLPVIIEFLEKYGYYLHALYDYRGHGHGNYGNVLFVNKDLISK